MERGLFARIRSTLRTLGRRRRTRRFRYTDAGVLEVYLWAVLHDRPVSWACDPAHWPPGTRRGPIPDASTVSRRMRSDAIVTLIERLRRRLRPRERRTLVAMIDGKPLPIGPNSHDRQSGYGRGASGKAKGYKAHVVIDANAHVLAWRLSPMNGDERTIARRILRDLDHSGYLLADSGYESNPLFRIAERRGMQLISPRYRSRRGAALGHREHAASRRRSIEFTEHLNAFREAIFAQRGDIERLFGQMSTGACCMGPVPSWVRSWRRTRNWFAAKLTIHAARQAAREEKMVQ